MILRAAAAAVVMTAGLLAAAPADRTAVRLVQDASRALQAGNAPLFLSYFDRKSMPESDRLRALVEALVAQKDVASSVDVGPGANGSMEVDWLLQLSPKGDVGNLETRRETVTLTVAERDGKLRIVALEPVEFFRPR